MRFSLIVATKGRVEPLHLLLRSLVEQEHPDFQVVVVDQNPPGTLDGVLAAYQGRLDLVHIPSDARGLSAARNVGLARPLAEAVAFPDDDCFFDRWTLANAARALAGEPRCDAILGRLLVPQAAAAAAATPQLRVSARADGRCAVFRDAGSVVHFYRTAVVRRVGGFDERIGAGAPGPYGSGEDSDYLVRTVDAGFLVRRSAGIRIYHPAVDPLTPNLPAKAFGYGRGRWYVLRKHRLPLWFKLANLLHPLLLLAFGRRGMAGYRWHMLRGRVRELLAGADA